MSVEVYWLAEGDVSVPSNLAWLSVREIGVLGRLSLPKRRADWILGRWAAKRALAARLGLMPVPDTLAGIELWQAPSGAPIPFVRGVPVWLSLSLSHSHGVAFCVVAGGRAELGCDVERIAWHGDAFLNDCFAAEERSAVERSPAAERATLLTLFWSAKESTLKALQLGLRSDLRSVVVTGGRAPGGSPCAWNRLQTQNPHGRLFQGWWRQTGDLLWTLVANPAPQSPTPLDADAQ